jgi:hypothetical protein
VIELDPDRARGQVAKWSTTDTPLAAGYLQAALVDRDDRPARIRLLAGCWWTDPDQLRAAARLLDHVADRYAAHLANDGRQLQLGEATP